MNQIEQMFYDTFLKLEENEEIDSVFYLLPQQVIGIYKADFVYGNSIFEIDGHESHKTKEQREYDYKRERYFIRNRHSVIRFMGTEVFLSPEKCVKEAVELANLINDRDIELYCQGFDSARGGNKNG